MNELRKREDQVVQNCDALVNVALRFVDAIGKRKRLEDFDVRTNDDDYYPPSAPPP
ncbi:hypothetical protein SARC_14044, partial [Sphaeroforma arctica JP610]